MNPEYEERAPRPAPKRPSGPIFSARTVMLAGASLLSESGENEEYDRAIVELVSDLLGISTDERETVETMLRGLQR